MVLSEANHNNGGVVLSSIALLQERFRQLQRMRELRQEKDFLRKLSECHRSHSPPITNFNPNPKKILGSELILLAPKPHYSYDHQLSLSLWPDSQTCPLAGDQTPSDPAAKSWFSDAPHHRSAVCGSFDQNSDCDIDTSLRL